MQPIVFLWKWAVVWTVGQVSMCMFFRGNDMYAVQAPRPGETFYCPGTGNADGCNDHKTRKPLVYSLPLLFCFWALVINLTLLRKSDDGASLSISVFYRTAKKQRLKCLDYASWLISDVWEMRGKPCRFIGLVFGALLVSDANAGRCLVVFFWVSRSLFWGVADFNLVLLFFWVAMCFCED